MATITGMYDVCPSCAGDVDPENHAYNPTTGEKYCSIDCWSEAVLA